MSGVTVKGGCLCGAVLIPAGSLDTAPPVLPQGGIIRQSRDEQDSQGELPGFAEYPPEK